MIYYNLLLPTYHIDNCEICYENYYNFKVIYSDFLAYNIAKWSVHFNANGPLSISFLPQWIFFRGEIEGGGSSTNCRISLSFFSNNIIILFQKSYKKYIYKIKNKARHALHQDINNKVNTINATWLFFWDNATWLLTKGKSGADNFLFFFNNDDRKLE